MAARMQLPPTASPLLPSRHPSPSNPPVAFQRASDPHPWVSCPRGDTAVSERLAAAPAPGDHVPEPSGRWLGQQRDPSSADPTACCLGGCTHPQGSGWQFSFQQHLKRKDRSTCPSSPRQPRLGHLANSPLDLDHTAALMFAELSPQGRLSTVP